MLVLPENSYGVNIKMVLKKQLLLTAVKNVLDAALILSMVEYAMNPLKQHMEREKNKGRFYQIALGRKDNI